MSAATTERPVPVQRLLEAAAHLSTPELEKVFSDVVRLRAERREPHLSSEETRLLLEINATLAEATWQRYTSLYAKLELNTITAGEYTELLHLIDVVEIDNARHIGRLVELAHLRGTTLDALMTTLGIRPRVKMRDKADPAIERRREGINSSR